MRGLKDAMPSDDADVLQDYFNAGASLGKLPQTWVSKYLRFCNVHPYFPGLWFWSSEPLIGGLKDGMECNDEAGLGVYFSAGESSREIAQTWIGRDSRFCNVHPYIPGFSRIGVVIPPLPED